MANANHTPAVQADDQREMDGREFLRQMLQAPDLTTREVAMIERLDDALDYIDDLDQQLREYARGARARV